MSQDVVENLIDEVVELAEKGNIVIVVVEKRHSYSEYDYKVSNVLVVFSRERGVKPVRELRISAGAYQEYPLAIDKILMDEITTRTDLIAYNIKLP